jgi:hypothetical protein
MTAVLEPALVRIYHQAPPDRRAVGAGFLISDRHVLTCAHVVTQALLGVRTPGLPEPPPGALDLDFPLLPGTPVPAAVTPVCWGPREEAGDLAVLELTGVPAQARPAPLVIADDVYGHAFRAFGFPREDKGRWSDGYLQGRDASGNVLLRGQDQTGYRVQGGFSGSPVWDTVLQGVVGMVVTSVEGDRGEALRVASAIPTATVAATWPIRDVIRVPARPPQAAFSMAIELSPVSGGKVIDLEEFPGRSYLGGCKFRLTLRNKDSAPLLVSRMALCASWRELGALSVAKTSYEYSGALLPHQLYIDLTRDGYSGWWQMSRGDQLADATRRFDQTGADLFDSPDLPRLALRIPPRDVELIDGAIRPKEPGLYQVQLKVLATDATGARMAVASKVVQLIHAEFHP